MSEYVPQDTNSVTSFLGSIISYLFESTLTALSTVFNTLTNFGSQLDLQMYGTIFFSFAVFVGSTYIIYKGVEFIAIRTGKNWGNVSLFLASVGIVVLISIIASIITNGRTINTAMEEQLTTISETASDTINQTINETINKVAIIDLTG